MVDGEASVIPLGDECEDVVVLWHVLEHLLDPPTSLREVHRVLKPGGLLFIATPNPESLTARLIGQRWIHYAFIESGGPRPLWKELTIEPGPPFERITVFLPTKNPRCCHVETWVPEHLTSEQWKKYVSERSTARRE